MILITGLTGYIGSHIAHCFDKCKINYLGIDDLSYSYKSNIKNKRKFFLCNISNEIKIKRLIKKYKIKTVIHAAASSYVLEAEKMSKKYVVNNVTRTKKFIDLCKVNNIEKFIFLSSSNVYKENLRNNQFSENSKLLPKNIYGKNKLIIEKYLKKKNFKNTIILRLFNIIGKFNKNFKIYKFKKKNYQRLIFKFIQKKKEKQILTLNYFKKKNKRIFPSRDFINIKDVTNTIKKISDKNFKIPSNIFVLNIGTGKSLDVNKLINSLNKVFKYKIKIVYKEISNKELLITRSNNKKFIKIMKYRPKLNLYKTLKSHL